MTTTEPTEIVDDRAARLARLQARRGTSPCATPTASGPASRPTTAFLDAASLPAPTTVSIERTAPPDPLFTPLPTTATGSTFRADADHGRVPKQTRRHSPATSAKIITIGASTTALLGMMAGYGMADGLTNESTETVAATPATPIAPIAPIASASPVTTPPVPVTTTPPQVIVVLVDAETGRPISTTTGSGEGVLESALGSLPGSSAPAAQPAAPAAQPTAPADPVPVAAPAAVDLAVPAAPQPAPAPQQAPQPQASSGGS